MSELPSESELTELLDTLAASPLFGRLDRAARAELSDHLSFVTLAAGETLFRQGDPGDSMYLVERGLLEVRTHAADGTIQVLDRLDSGAGVGEMALLTGRPRTADVVAVVDSRLLRVAKVGFDRLVERHPAVASGFAVAITPRIKRLQLAGLLVRLFGDLEPAALHAMQKQMPWRRLADGEALFQQGEIGTSMYLVVNGRFQVVLPATDEEPERVLGEIGAGETVGEYALLTDDVRSATIYATRDTDVVEMTRPVFETLTREHPRAMAEVARIIVQRQKRALRPELVDRPEALTLAIFPAGPDGAPLAGFAHELRQSLAAFGPTALFSSDTFDAAYGKPGAAQTEPDDVLSIVLNSWLQEQERHYAHILYVADAEWSHWTQRCLAQADRILLTGMAGAAPQPGPLEHVCNPRTRKELVLLHPADEAEPTGTLAWLEGRELAAFHHVRQGDPTHWQRLARRLTGRAVGVVLSGGAARGLAHIGVARALEEAGQPVDIIGGTSMGALLGAMWARGTTPAEGMVLAERMANPRMLFDRTFPYTSIMASRKITQVARELFGERQIEDLWRPFLCVSTNLSVAAPVVHERGPLWRAVRASIALPGIFSPVLNDKNELLVDGGVMNNFPLDIMAARYELGLLIGSNVSPHRERPYPHTFGESISGWQVLWSRVNPFGQPLRVPTLAGTILRTMEVNSLYQRRTAEQLADVLIEPDVREFNFLDFAAYRELEQRGYEAGRAAVNRL